MMIQRVFGWCMYFILAIYGVVLGLGGVPFWDNKPILALISVSAVLCIQGFPIEETEAKPERRQRDRFDTVQRGFDAVSLRLFDGQKGGWPW